MKLSENKHKSRLDRKHVCLWRCIAYIPQIMNLAETKETSIQPLRCRIELLIMVYYVPFNQTVTFPLAAANAPGIFLRFSICFNSIIIIMTSTASITRLRGFDFSAELADVHNSCNASIGSSRSLLHPSDKVKMPNFHFYRSRISQSELEWNMRMSFLGYNKGETFNYKSVYLCLSQFHSVIALAICRSGEQIINIQVDIW